MPGYRSDEDGRYGVTGIHKGKGPRGYQRSDERIKDDINDHLADDSFIDASDVEVNVKDSEVTLIGTVESRDAKRRAEDIGESVSGVKNVENRLRVKRNTDWTNRDGNSEDRTIGTQRSNVREAIR
jgi:osmotically-inducible protein OsmY